ncbi:MAG: winged helix-turn-helix domain-containing protein [Thermodesulfovibrionales bacterium]|nr:winged helix-turn-helix domain-containing protein [Thermodesulfovibrionales bacterium]
MLKTLFSSSTRVDILSLLLNNPEEKFYIRQIAAILKRNPAGVKRELDKLEDMELVISEKVANLKYFQANKNSALFSELKSIIAKSLGLSGALKSLFRGNSVKAAFIYGPYVEDDESPVVDLLVIGPSTPTILMGLQDIEKKFNKSFNCTFMDYADFKLRKKTDINLRKILQSKKINLIGSLR